MKIKLKMLGDLRQYLPAGAQFNRCELDIAAGSTAQTVLAIVQLPTEKTFLLMVNGDMVPQADYATTSIRAGDEVVLFPPIKGG
ncbi:MAG: MoaD/ThiS family protein [Thiolinea sp.]